MSGIRAFAGRRAGTIGAVAAVVFYVAVSANAQPAEEEAGDRARGRIDFEVADLPAAAVEIDLTQGMLRDLLGLGDAAIEGVAESLLNSAGGGRPGGEGTRMAAEQLAAARQIVQLVSDLVHEARVRVYRGMDDGPAGDVAARFDDQLRTGNWDNAVRARDGGQSVRVSLLRENGALRGVFVVARQGPELVLVNVACDISPANIKKLTAAAAKIGLDNGLAPMIEMKMRELHRTQPPAPPRPPQPEDI